MDLPKPDLPAHLFRGPVVSYFPNMSIDDKLDRLRDALNLTHAAHSELQVAMHLLAAAVAKQPGIQRELLFADFMDLAEAHFRTPAAEAVPAIHKSIGWFLKNG